MAMAEYTLMNKNHPVVSFRYDGVEIKDLSEPIAEVEGKNGQH